MEPHKWLTEINTLLWREVTVNCIALLLMGQILHGLKCRCTWKKKITDNMKMDITGFFWFLQTSPDKHLKIQTHDTSELWTTGIVGWHRLGGGKRWCMLWLGDSVRAMSGLSSRVLPMLCSTGTKSRLRLEMACLQRGKAHILKYTQAYIQNTPKHCSYTEMSHLQGWPGTGRAVCSGPPEEHQGAHDSPGQLRKKSIQGWILDSKSNTYFGEIAYEGHLACWEGAVLCAWPCWAGMLPKSELSCHCVHIFTKVKD